MSDADLESLLQRFPEGEAPDPERRAELRRRVLEEFDQSRRIADASFARRLWNKGTKIMTHPVSRAAAIAAALLLSFWVLTPNPAQAAFDKLIKPLVEATNAKYKAVTSIEGQQEVTLTGYFLAPSRIRQEGPDLVSVMDMGMVQMLTLTPSIKQALVIEPTKKKEGARMETYFGDLRKMLEGYKRNPSMGVKDLGEKVVGGRKAFGFGFEQFGVVNEIWGDSETYRLLRIAATFPGAPRMTTVISDFEFDVKLDEKLFSLEPPAGYKVIKTKINTDPATEDDMTATLKRLAELSNGELPGGFDGASMGMAFAKAFTKVATDKPGVDEELYKMAMELGRGMTFPTTLPAEADAHYAGRGVKTGGEAKPIFWYKPKGESKYRVLSTDWKWTEAEAAPSAPNAVKLGGFPKAAFKK